MEPVAFSDEDPDVALKSPPEEAAAPVEDAATALLGGEAPATTPEFEELYSDVAILECEDKPLARDRNAVAESVAYRLHDPQDSSVDPDFALPRGDNEAVCAHCFLIVPRSRVRDTDTPVCHDCA